MSNAKDANIRDAADAPLGVKEDVPAVESPDRSESRAEWFVEGLKDMLHYGGGPLMTERFDIKPITSGDWNRLFRLLVIITFLSGVFLGIPNIFGAQLNAGEGLIKGIARIGFDAVVVTSAPCLYMIVGGFALAILYTLCARPCRIRIGLQQSFFIILFITLPWIPAWAFINSLDTIDFIPKGVSSYFILIWYYVAPIPLILNFFLTVRAATSCSKWSIIGSIAIASIFPLFLFVLLVIYILQAGL